MFKRCYLLLAVLPFAATAADETVVETREEGDVLIIEEVEQPPARSPGRSADRRVPTRGMAMDNVRNVYGEPQQTHGAVGDPPITRWDYDGFSVFFEHDKVIHSVLTD